ncbi:MAG: pilin [Patescibacteria group bacterium]
MHPFRAFLLIALAFCVFMPQPLIAAELPLLDPGWSIVPDPSELDSSCRPTDPLGMGGILVLVQNLMNAAVSLTVIVMVIVIAYAGFLFLTSPFNSENRSKAKSTLAGTFMGVIIVLAGWLLVDFVMKVVYDPDAVFAGKQIGPWSQIITGGDACIKARDTKPLFGSLPFSPGGGPSVNAELGAGGGYAGPGQPASLGTADCSPSRIATAAAAGGYRLTDAQANTFSCLAKSESSCGQNISGAKTKDGKSTTAHGMFQVVMGYDDQCHNLNIPVCSAAAKRAGWTGSGNLNCSTAFSGGKPKKGMEALANVCKAASASIDCNASAAACLVKESPSFRDWTGTGDGHTHAAQKACVAKYAK